MTESPKPPARSVFPAGHFARMEHCWEKGADARELGFARVSPYYEDLDADWFWFAGFDGQSFQATLQLLSQSQTERTHHEATE